MRWTRYFWDLPNELILDILSFDLSLSDLQHLRLQSRRFRAHVDAALKLLYRREVQAAAVVDDPTSSASLMERIARLRRWEIGFRNFNGSEIDIDTLCHVNRPGGGISPDDIVDINCGFLLVSSPTVTRTYSCSSTSGIFYARLPSIHHLENVGWQRVPFTRDPEEVIRAFQLVAELDLLAIVTSRKSSPEDMHHLTLHLCTFSTAHGHPWASRPSIRWTAGNGVPNFHSQLHVKLLVVSDNVGLLLTVRTANYSQFLVFNWKTGRQKMTSTTVYDDFCFLSEDVVLFTAPSQNRLDLCCIVESSKDQPQQVSAGLHLLLPKLNEDAEAVLRAVCCNTSPLDNHTTVAMPNAHPLYLPPFRPSSRDSIIVFNLIYAMIGPLMILDYAAFRFVVHRQALLDLLALSVTERSAEPQRLAWSDWGPVRTRWFAATEDQDTFLGVMSGQRYISVASKDYQDNFPVTLYDFNPQNIPGSDHAVTYRARTEYVEPYRSHDIQPFGEEVWSELPYIRKVWLTNYDGMECAMMDDERIILFPVRIVPR
ncbi:hypothetical protein PILCRDRAFT_607606 [Piloderma croceum F 1598]|uniref:F-box domain-containing protein n=1 Tax=Piloderma croceum (strain F 1598) TaxID=765440 RepID=A0A0C3AVH8_PILCF|nr:hypothetical protein PILCRDRAFT_607606 [Piloderma croceum F 1598]